MIVILEGVNCTGKSTMAEFLRRAMGFRYLNDDTIHSAQAPDEIKQLCEGGIKALTEAFKSLSGINLLVDRFHLTEYVHGLLDRGYDASYIIEIDKQLSLLGAKLLYMTDDIFLINERVGKDLTRYKNAFDNAFLYSSIDKRYYNLLEPVPVIVDWLTKGIEDEKKQTVRYASEVSGQLNFFQPSSS